MMQADTQLTYLERYDPLWVLDVLELADFASEEDEES